MKKIVALLLAVLVVFSMAACGSKSDIDASDGISVEECFLAVAYSKSAKEMAKYLCAGDAEEYYGRVKNLFGGDTYTVTAEFSGTYKDYEVFYLTVKSKTDKSKEMKNFEIFKKVGNDYKLALDAKTINEINENCVCPTCNATGTAMGGGTACAICAGTGVQYYPNAYYDAGTGMWQGETRACSGCAGAGYLGGSVKTCTTCKGRKYVFN